MLGVMRAGKPTGRRRFLHSALKTYYLPPPSGRLRIQEESAEP
uniref:Uncharacterized protein n=1 Tax=Anguilla anguilla TaxID=7936 RepID=A0A0E9SFP1_ANGAN